VEESIFPTNSQVRAVPPDLLRAFRVRAVARQVSDRLSFKHLVFITLQTMGRLARYVLAFIVSHKRVHRVVWERLWSPE
jgi:hypothetical protein